MTTDGFEHAFTTSRSYDHRTWQKWDLDRPGKRVLIPTVTCNILILALLIARNFMNANV